MSTSETPAYGVWPLVVINAAVFIIFAFSFSHPRTGRDWRSFGAFSAFLVALFTEMYGFPLTIYLLSGWLQSRFPGLDPFGHDAGHLPEVLLSYKGDPHFSPLHLLSYVFIGGGFILLSASWNVLFAVQRQHTLAITGPYARATPAVHRLRPDHVRVPAPVADTAHAGDVPNPGHHVRAAGPP